MRVGCWWNLGLGCEQGEDEGEGYDYLCPFNFLFTSVQYSTKFKPIFLSLTSISHVYLSVLLYPFVVSFTTEKKCDYMT